MQIWSSKILFLMRNRTFLRLFKNPQKTKISAESLGRKNDYPRISKFIFSYIANRSKGSRTLMVIAVWFPSFCVLYCWLVYSDHTSQPSRGPIWTQLSYYKLSCIECSWRCFCSFHSLKHVTFSSLHNVPHKTEGPILGVQSSSK